MQHNPKYDYSEVIFIMFTEAYFQEARIVRQS